MSHGDRLENTEKHNEKQKNHEAPHRLQAPTPSGLVTFEKKNVTCAYAFLQKYYSIVLAQGQPRSPSICKHFMSKMIPSYFTVWKTQRS